MAFLLDHADKAAKVIVPLLISCLERLSDKSCPTTMFLAALDQLCDVVKGHVGGHGATPEWKCAAVLSALPLSSARAVMLQITLGQHLSRCACAAPASHGAAAAAGNVAAPGNEGAALAGGAHAARAADDAALLDFGADHDEMALLWLEALNSGNVAKAAAKAMTARVVPLCMDPDACKCRKALLNAILTRASAGPPPKRVLGAAAYDPFTVPSQDAERTTCAAMFYVYGVQIIVLGHMLGRHVDDYKVTFHDGKLGIFSPGQPEGKALQICMFPMACDEVDVLLETLANAEYTDWPRLSAPFLGPAPLVRQEFKAVASSWLTVPYGHPGKLTNPRKKPRISEVEDWRSSVPWVLMVRV